VLGATIEVNTGADVVAADGKCSLREAIASAGGKRGLTATIGFRIITSAK
jgi:CSLREA domain-containing protein